MRLPWKRVHQDDSNDTPQPMWVELCQNLYCGLRLAWIILIHRKGFGRAQPIWVVGCHWNRLNEPVFIAALLFRLTKVGYFEKIVSAVITFVWILLKSMERITCLEIMTKWVKSKGRFLATAFLSSFWRVSYIGTEIWGGMLRIRSLIRKPRFTLSPLPPEDEYGSNKNMSVRGRIKLADYRKAAVV